MVLIEQSAGHHLISLASYGKEEMGYLIPLDEEIPFKVKRFFYLTDVPQEGEREFIYHLCDNKQGFYLEPQVWREAYEFSEGAVLLVLSSKEYSEEDYIRS